MNAESRDASQADRRAAANEIDVLCDEFENSWRGGKHPTIEQYLRRVPDAQQSLLLEELLELELELSEEAAIPIDAAAYVARFPQARHLVRDVFGRAGTRTNLTLATLPAILGGDKWGARQTLAAPLAELQRLASERRFAADEPLIRQGDEATSLTVIREGVAEIRVQDDDGRSHVIGSVGPGQVLGEMALLTKEPCTASAIAVEPVCAAVLPASSFHGLCQRYPQLSSLLTELIADRLGNAQHDALTDKRLDRYRIRRRLGRGGMSVVYEAIDTTNNLPVALKMMSHRLVCSPAALDRFQREADLIERFDHPHIVRMYRRFAAFRTYFIVMEYCVGETLSRHLERHGPMDEPAFRHAMGQLAAAMQHAHHAGIVHRDIKPSNIMRLPDGNLKLMDFGLAEPAAEATAADGELAGTPRYMAPEQRVRGAADKRADYFSLGCVAYEMLTASPLFQRRPLLELTRDFDAWQPPDFTQLGTTLTEETAAMLQPLLAITPEARQVDLHRIAMWSESE
ncbi:MAG: protein kinase [Pirellulaceae bacterium]